MTNFNWEVGLIEPFLKLVGVWPINCVHSRILFIVNLMMQFFVLSTYIPSVFMSSSIIRAIDKIFATIAIILGFFNLCIFRYQWHNIKAIIEFVKENWKNYKYMSIDNKAIMISHGIREKRFAAFLFSSFGVSLIFFAVQPFLMHYFNPELLITQPNNPWYPFDITISPAFEITYFMQILCYCSSAIIFSAIDSSIIWLIFHCCGQSEILMNCLNHYKGIVHHDPHTIDENERINCSCLDCIVTHHLELKKKIFVLDDALHMIMLLRLIACTVHFISTGYMIIKFKEEGNFMALLVDTFYLITMNASLFIYCWLGDRLYEKSMNLADTAFNRQIYGKIHIRYALVMIIQQTQVRPFRVTAGKFFTLSLQLYKQYLSQAVSYLSVLMAIRFNGRS